MNEGFPPERDENESADGVTPEPVGSDPWADPWGEADEALPREDRGDRQADVEGSAPGDDAQPVEGDEPDPGEPGELDEGPEGTGELSDGAVRESRPQQWELPPYEDSVTDWDLVIPDEDEDEEETFEEVAEWVIGDVDDDLTAFAKEESAEETPEKAEGIEWGFITPGDEGGRWGFVADLVPDTGPEGYDATRTVKEILGLGEPDVAPDPEPGGVPEPAPDPWTATGPVEASGIDADADADADAGAESELEPEGGADPWSAAATVETSEVDVDAEVEVDGEADADADADPAPEVEVEVGSEPEPERGADPWSAVAPVETSEVDVDVDVDVEADVEADPDADPAPEVEVGSEPEPDPEGESDPWSPAAPVETSEVDVDVDVEVEVDGEADADAEVEVEVGSESEPEGSSYWPLAAPIETSEADAEADADPAVDRVPKKDKKTKASRWIADSAWLGGEALARNVLLEVVDGRFARVEPSSKAKDAERLRGIVLPGLVNTHSHAFHRLLRGRTHRQGGDFWSWRDRMYEVAVSLDPLVYEDVAAAVFAEMALAGITTVGEFHYLHHRIGGVPYRDSNEMGHAVIRAARRAGIRIGLLDAGYLTAGFDRSTLHPVQERFSDKTTSAWLERVDELMETYQDQDDVRIGVAPHSVRAVPLAGLEQLAGWSTPTTRIQIHVSEQPAENLACVAAHGITPVGLLDQVGLLGPNTTIVHGTHLTDTDITSLGSTRTGVCICPTTERDLADGIGPTRALRNAGSPLTVGSDSQAVIDLFEEARGIELHHRLAAGRRGGFAPATLLEAATVNGASALGFEPPRLAAGAPADFVRLDHRSPRLAGLPARAESVVFAATGADVRDVFVGGRRIVAKGKHPEWKTARKTFKSRR